MFKDLTGDEDDKVVLSGARSGTDGSTTKVRELQATARARIRKNGNGNESGTGRMHLGGAYPRGEQEQASLSSVNRRRSEGERAGAKGIMPEKMREWGRCAEENAPEWPTDAVD